MFKNLVANYLGQGWTALMGLLFIPLYIQYLGIEAYGVIRLFALLTAWFSLLDMGMTPKLSREKARLSPTVALSAAGRASFPRGLFTSSTPIVSLDTDPSPPC